MNGIELKIQVKEEAESFESIAKLLINHHHLLVNNSKLQLCDLEFYWNDGGQHADNSTHQHDYKNGQLRPHGSGYDIVLRNERGYGGILIRGLIMDGIPTYGPIRCADKIFKSGDNLLKEGFLIKLVEKRSPSTWQVFSTPRIGLKREGEFWDKNYRFIRCSTDYLYQIEGKTKILEAIERRGLVDQSIIDEASRKPRRKER